jgi:site-specific DNA recombinase
MASVTEPTGRHALYARVSSEDQAQAGTIEGQLAELRRWCELRGISPVDVYADDGVSGSVPFEQRTQGARLMGDASTPF